MPPMYSYNRSSLSFVSTVFDLSLKKQCDISGSYTISAYVFCRPLRGLITGCFGFHGLTPVALCFSPATRAQIYPLNLDDMTICQMSPYFQYIATRPPRGMVPQFLSTIQKYRTSGSNPCIFLLCACNSVSIVCPTSSFRGLR